jgi:CheY-like chemotaxis protein
VSAERVDEGACIAVRDQGRGMSPETLARIFERYWQPAGSTHSGLGLGLYIAKGIVEAHGGGLRAESTLGEGSTFSLYVPMTHFSGKLAPPASPGISIGTHVFDAEPSEAVEMPVPAPVLPGEEGRRLLVVESRPNGLLSQLAQSVVGDLPETHGPVRVTTASNPESALAALIRDCYHCIVLDLGMPHDAAAEFLRRLDEDSILRSLPVLAHHTRKLTRPQENLLQGRSRTQPLERLPSLDELRERITLHLSAEGPGDVLPLVQASPDEASRDVEKVDSALLGRKVLVIDDDVRNVFALTNILELHGMQVLYAENGRKGIEVLMRNEDVDLVLMDIMMPEMDGYAATAAIRDMPRFVNLPIIAVTAKAMQGDREKTLSSGASDYVTKPVDAEELIDRMQRWLEL